MRNALPRRPDATDRLGPTSWPLLGRRHGVVLSPVKLWVLAMLAPRRELCVAPVPPQAANLTGLVRDRRGNGRSGRRNRRCDRTKEHGSASASPSCPADYSPDTVMRPMVGETANASHTEILLELCLKPSVIRTTKELQQHHRITQRRLDFLAEEGLPAWLCCSFGHFRGPWRYRTTH
jgi:hypothetical protein